MGKYIDLETHVRPNDSMSLMTIKEMLKKYTDGYSKEAQVELVRCRDCKHFNHLYNLNRNACGCPQGCVRPEPDGFCSYGERKG